jgi:hypothetical protein
MKAPQNFAQKIKGHKFESSDGKPFQLGDSMGDRNHMWIYPVRYSRNVIMVEFDWKRETYKLNIARQGDGNNFHTILPAEKFGRTHFLDFRAFNMWISIQTRLWNNYFEFQ